MVRRRMGRASFNIEEVVEFFNHLYVEKPFLPFFIPLVLVCWGIERWVFSLSSWVPLVLAVWATIQYCSNQRQILVEDLNRKWKRVVLNTSPATPLEHCEWLNKLLIEVWPNYINPKLSIRFSSMVEKRLKQRKSKFIERIELLEFSLGSSPPSLGLHGIRWSTLGDQRFMHVGFDWDTNDISIMLLAKLAKPMGTARIVINSLHIKGDLLIVPALDGKAILYSFVSTPEVRIGVAFGSGGSQSLPATELPGVSSWLMKYVADDSTMFWAVGPNSGVIAEHVEFCGEEVEVAVPFEGLNSGELSVKLVLKEWQFSDGSRSFNKFHVSSWQSMDGLSNTISRTGRKINVIVVEGKDLTTKERSGKCGPYVKLQYGKVFHRTRSAYAPNPIWNQKFEVDEIGGGEYLKIKCFSEEIFGDDNIGSAQVNMEGLVEGSIRDVWVPLENVNSGELRLQIEAVRADGCDGSKGSTTGSDNGWIELVVIEARDLVAADLRGTSDPYVRVQYGNLKKRTKVTYKTLNPQWNQTLDFPDDGSPLELHVKDHNALLPTSSIGNCVVEYQRLPTNQMSDKWIPLQGVKRGEIHIQITRKVPEVQKRLSLDSETSVIKSHEFSSQMREMVKKFQSLIGDRDLEGLSTVLSEMEGLEDSQEDYMEQLETEQMLLLNKIKELGEEMFNSSTSMSRRPSVS
ncbi:uncharacterized protein LOC110662430 isoform X2 [Hevea brasiliensis]|uniref:uncharacterized protein LOC110662430 isoform X2 n=1 Tax=Hevea brasiliensis TaxID=3981 RepID=UPI0025E5F12E|nr:uncharacterized protein LOC110662430 isoform X2 [Hevea brasiliensis]